MKLFRVAIVLAALVALPTASTAEDLPTLYQSYLDLSDATTVNYVSSQLQAAGISSADYPTLYSTLQQSQQIYANAKAKGINIPQVVVTSSSDDLDTIYTTVPSYSTSNGTVSAQSVTTVPNEPTTTVQTVGIYNGSKTVASPTADITVGGTATLVTSVSGKAVSGVTDYTAEGASTFVYPATVLGESVMAQLNLTAEDDIALAQATDMAFSTTTSTVSITNDAPVDTKNVGYIKDCLVRSDSDCSYVFKKINGQWVVQLPLKGSATFSEAIATDPTTGLPTNPQYSVAIYYPDVGGGCTMPNTSFASQVKVNGKTASWNANPAQFGAPCSDIPYGKTVDVVYQLLMGFTSTSGNPLVAAVTSEQGSTVANVYRTEPMEFVYGCIAPGSKISLADGTTREIEKIVVGDKLLGQGGKSLEVTAYSRGPETKRLFTVQTADGKTVELTDTHPVPLADGTTKLAQELAVGDVVLTSGGSSALSKITERSYNGDVWNLALGKPQPSKLTLKTEEHSFFANGILVGDTRAQAHFNRVHRDSPQEILSRLPKRWHKDFHSAQLRELHAQSR